MSTPKNTKKTLWESASAIMRWRYGGESLTYFARDCGLATATSSRMKEQRTELRISTIDAIAEGFGFEPWQLLVPGFDPERPPRLEGSRLPANEQALIAAFRAMNPDSRELLIARAETMAEMDSAEAMVRPRAAMSAKNADSGTQEAASASKPPRKRVA